MKRGQISFRDQKKIGDVESIIDRVVGTFNRKLCREEMNWMDEREAIWQN